MFQSLIFSAILVATAASPEPAKSESIDVVATNWAFTAASKVVLHVGTPATFHFTSKEGVHGAVSQGLGIPSTTLMPGKAATIVVTPKKAGVYKITCSIPCGSGHADMVLLVNVEA